MNLHLNLFLFRLQITTFIAVKSFNDEKTIATGFGIEYLPDKMDITIVYFNMGVHLIFIRYMGSRKRFMRIIRSITYLLLLLIVSVISIAIQLSFVVLIAIVLSFIF